MEDGAIRSWFAEYMDAFAAEVREPSDDLAGLLCYYAVPLLMTTDEGPNVAASASDARGFIEAQVKGMRAQGYSHTEILGDEIERLNATTALYRCELSRRAGDTELARLRVAYLLAEGGVGRRINAVVVLS